VSEVVPTGTVDAAASWPAPDPGSAPRARMVAAQAGLELRILLRNGEQLLLTLIIPVALLAGFSLEPLIKTGSGTRIDFLVPGIMALAVMSTAFTSQAIATGFERRYGVLKRLGSTPLGRDGLIAAKTSAASAIFAENRASRVSSWATRCTSPARRVKWQTKPRVLPRACARSWESK